MRYSCEITARPTKDGVMQSVTFVDGHCVKIRLFPNCSDTLIVQLIANAWMQRLTHNLAGHTIEPNSLLHDRVVWFDRHGVGQKVIFVRHLHIAHIHELFWRPTQQSRQAARRRSHHGWRVRPRRPPAGVRSEVATPRRGRHTFVQKHLEPKWLEPKWATGVCSWKCCW